VDTEIDKRLKAIAPVDVGHRDVVLVAAYR
jgi:hypothetical protein